MTAPATIAEVLEKAADLLEPEGRWAQAGTGDLDYNCLCADLALQASGRETFFDASEFFARFIGGKSSRDIWVWNDDPSRTQSEVVAALRCAAALAREQGA